MGNLPKGTSASLPPRYILGHFRWPRPAREASMWPSKALACISCVLIARVDGAPTLGPRFGLASA
eukprot:8352147-Pyramimonas_sp.AAC.1